MRASAFYISFIASAILCATVAATGAWSDVAAAAPATSATRGREASACGTSFGKLAEAKSVDKKESLDSDDMLRARALIRKEAFAKHNPNETLFQEISVSPNGLAVLQGKGAITGPSDYRLIDVKKNLKLTEDYLHTLPHGARVLSVGEGIGDLAENLRMKFPNTKALDLWYGDPLLPKHLADYVATNRPYLIVGSSTRMPVTSRSMDLVVSHMLLNNLDDASALKSIAEMIRVLKVGGEARIAFGDFGQKDVAAQIKLLYGSEVTVVAERWNSNWGTGMRNHACQTLYIRRVQNGFIEN